MKILLTLLFIFILSLAGVAQTSNSEANPTDKADCPTDKICLSRTEAENALRAVDERDALREETKVKTQAIEDLKKEIVRLQIDLSLKSGELIGEKSITIQQRAIIQMMIPMLRKKKIGLINIW